MQRSRSAPPCSPASAPGTVKRLGTAAGAAMAIGDDGTIAGTAGDGEAPWIWDTQGNGHALATPPGVVTVTTPLVALTGT